MKKMLVAAMFLLLPFQVRADMFGDQLKTALLSQVQPITQYMSNGESRISLLDDVFQIGHYKGSYLGFGQIGPSTTVDSGEGRIEGYVIGGSFNWSPILKKFFTLPAGWKFLNEQFIISSGYHYDTGLRKGTFSYLQLSVAVPL